MPVFSLPSRFGIGSFGKEAERFIDFLEKAGQSYWQILPLGPTSFGDSPYQAFSSFAGNPYFIDIDSLIDEGLLLESEALLYDFGTDESRVDYALLYENRLPLLRRAFSRFKPDKDYYDFCLENGFWLNEYVLFTAIKKAAGDKPWTEWDENLRNRDEAAIADFTAEFESELRFYKFLQYKFFSQWRALKSYANKKGIKIIGDIPIYVALDSADVWAEREQFLLRDGTPTAVAGCPPDAFTEEGQLWGNPLYDWDKMKADGYAWWKRRIGFSLSLFDVVRIDHFRGFEAYYAVPYGAENAKGGCWHKGPGIELFAELAKQFGDMPIIAEDLGFLTEPVRELLAATRFPGMKVLQFAFDSREESDYLPHNYTKNCVVYTGTHDNDTVLGWEKTAPTEDVEFAKKYMNAYKGEALNFAMLRLAMQSVADTAIFMMPDLLSCKSEARINTPSTLGENWVWRTSGGCINDWLAGIMREYTALYGRLPKGMDQ